LEKLRNKIDKKGKPPQSQEGRAKVGKIVLPKFAAVKNLSENLYLVGKLLSKNTKLDVKAPDLGKFRGKLKV